ncbi:MAG: hypothetical protein SOU82_00645 [Alloprevotella sp.]|nr:hypothetical protein [Bacteroidales bacterium]MDY2778353.1 hypothetical protein [Alloprevotella sp.]
MKKNIPLLLTLCLMWLVCAPSAAAKDKDTPGTVWLYGCATCLGDSVVYVTAVQQLDGVKINNKDHQLTHGAELANQLEKMLNQRYGQHFTAGVFFDAKRSKAESRYLKTLKHQGKAKAITSVVKLTADEFRFEPVAETTETKE